jgi:hypothetical protein
MPSDPVGTSNYNSILVCIHELLVKNQIPNGLEQLTFAVRQDVLCCCLIENAPIDILEVIWELSR